MSRKFNNRTLLIIVVVLATVLAITRLSVVKKKEKTLDTDLVRVDTSQVNIVRLYPHVESGHELVFNRDGGTWTVSRDGFTAPADPMAVRRAMAALQDLKAEQLVSRSRDSWEQYQVNDSLGTRILLEDGKKRVADLMIGRFEYRPAQNPYGGEYGRNQGTGITYVRKYGDKEIYAVEGFLALNFNRNFNQWRDQTLTRFNPAQITRISFEYPADSGFVAIKNETGWMAAGLQADSTSMTNYLNQVSGKRSDKFAEGISLTGAPDYLVSFEGENLQPIQVKAYRQSENEFLLNSSMNPDAWFKVGKAGVFSDLFIPVNKLISK